MEEGGGCPARDVLSCCLIRGRAILDRSGWRRLTESHPGDGDGVHLFWFYIC